MESSRVKAGFSGKSMRKPSPSRTASGDGDVQKDKRHILRSSSTFWHLFAFAKRQHTVSFALAVLAAACAAGAKTSYAIFLGKVMDVVAPLGAGTISKESAMASVSFWCAVLTAVGAAAWAFNSVFMAAWVIFGELVAKNTRETLFTTLLYKDMAWFDGQEEGLSSVLSSMHM